VQETLGADIAMVLDVPVNLPVAFEVAERSMYQTLRWAERSKNAKTRSDRALFGIVQGGADPTLRAISAHETARLGFPGFGIGGLAVGETPDERRIAIAATIPELPQSGVRYVMGLGDTEGILAAVALGVDLFDCVVPTRNGRHGLLFTAGGVLPIRSARFARDDDPPDPTCDCPLCSHHSRAYLRHLVKSGEALGARLGAVHNLRFYLRLLEDARAAIREGRFAAFRAERERAVGQGV